MKSFLQELAEKIVNGQPALEDLTIIFPNRRAVIYFRNHLSLLLTKPTFSPKLCTIEDFVAGFSNYRVPDRLELIHILYKIYQKVKPGRNDANGETESFDNFYFWGDMLLRDFDELDKYMINVRQLFKDLSNQKELDASFDFLTPEQQEFLLQFWGKFDGTAALNRRRFLNVWSILPEVYETFRAELHAKGIAYEGMLHRTVAGTLTIEMLKQYKPHSVVFAGFNALTATEETIINFLASHNLAEVHWDVDSYYVNDNQQEAGEFFRAYQQRPDLRKTFPADLPSNFLSKKKVQLIGASQHVGQTKALGQILRVQR